MTNNHVLVGEFEILPSRSIRVSPIGEFAQINRTGRGRLSGENSKFISDVLNSCSLDEGKSLLITLDLGDVAIGNLLVKGFEQSKK